MRNHTAFFYSPKSFSQKSSLCFSRQGVTVPAQLNLVPLSVAHCLPLEGKVGRSEAESRMRCLHSLIKVLNSPHQSGLRLTASPQGEANVLVVTPPCLFGISNSQNCRPSGRALLAPTLSSEVQTMAAPAPPLCKGRWIAACGKPEGLFVVVCCAKTIPQSPSVTAPFTQGSQ